MGELGDPPAMLFVSPPIAVAMAVSLAQDVVCGVEIAVHAKRVILHLRPSFQDFLPAPYGPELIGREDDDSAYPHEAKGRQRYNLNRRHGLPPRQLGRRCLGIGADDPPDRLLAAGDKRDGMVGYRR